jgi:hypothetical protein
MEMEADMPDGWGRCYHCQADCEEADYNPRTRQSICRRCDNYEPPDRDGGETWAERTAYEREQMEHIYRTLK